MFRNLKLYQLHEMIIVAKPRVVSDYFVTDILAQVYGAVKQKHLQ